MFSVTKSQRQQKRCETSIGTQKKNTEHSREHRNRFTYIWKLDYIIELMVKRELLIKWVGQLVIYIERN